MAAENPQQAFERLRREQHPCCVICGTPSRGGLGLRFRTVEEGVVEATFACQRSFEGYPDVLHGGVICALLDGAMTNCEFSLGFSAVTGDLYVRFLQQVAAKGSVTVRAWMKESFPPLHNLEAHLEQDGIVKATATGRFVERAAAAQLAESRSQ